MTKTNIQTPVDHYVFEYPQFAEMADEQMKIFWPHSEINVEKDKQDLLTGFTESEYHAVVTALKLFTKYELFVGSEYWSDRVMKMFPRPEIQRMAVCFAHVELNSHAGFYSKINEELGIATKEFYESYTENETLVSRMKFIQEALDSDNDLLSLATFSMLEGAVLYSSFAFLKHFQSNGKNKLTNVVRGINMSVRDENLHSVASAELFKQLFSEIVKIDKNIVHQTLNSQINEIASMLREHEHQIVDMLFEKGKIEGITDVQMKHFVDSRINLCLQNLGLDKLYEVKYNPIADYFYNGINNYVANDFFSGIGREYSRNWDSKGFVWA